MSKLITNTIRHVDGSNDNITLDSSQNVTVEGNLTVDGTSTLTGNVTASGQLKANALRHTGASSDAVTLASDGTCTVKATNNLSNRNLIINGACNVAQRGTSQTDVSGIQGCTTVDRFKIGWGGANNIIETHQSTLTSSDTGPWAKGFRKAYKLVNGAQSSADAGDHAYIEYNIEAQDIASSGWDYTNTSSYLTLSYWVKSSVAQTFYGYISTVDGSTQTFSISTGALSANTWKKVTVKIPGHANLQFDNNTAAGLTLYIIWPYCGTDRTTSGHTLNAWQAYSGSNRMPDYGASNDDWWLQDDATLEITGVQLEVGDVATDFEHRSYGDELARCQRYYQRYTAGGNAYRYVCMGSMDNDGNVGQMIMVLHKPMRANISSMDTSGTAGDYAIRRDSTKTCTSIPTLNEATSYSAYLVFTSTGTGWSTGDSLMAVLKSSSAYLGFSAEL